MSSAVRLAPGAWAFKRLAMGSPKIEAHAFVCSSDEPAFGHKWSSRVLFDCDIGNWQRWGVGKEAGLHFRPVSHLWWVYIHDYWREKSLDRRYINLTIKKNECRSPNVQFLAESTTRVLPEARTNGILSSEIIRVYLSYVARPATSDLKRRTGEFM